MTGAVGGLAGSLSPGVAAPPAAAAQAPPLHADDQLLASLGAHDLAWLENIGQEVAGQTTGAVAHNPAPGVAYAPSIAQALPFPNIPAYLPAAGPPFAGGQGILAGPGLIPFLPPAAGQLGAGAPARMNFGTVPSTTYVSHKRDLDELSDDEPENPRPTRKSKPRRTSSITPSRQLMDVFKEAVHATFREGMSRAKFCRRFQAAVSARSRAGGDVPRSCCWVTELTPQHPEYTQDITRWAENNRNELCRFNADWAERGHNVMRAPVTEEKSADNKPVVDQMILAAEKQAASARVSNQNAVAGPSQPTRSKRGAQNLRPPPMARSVSAPSAEAPAYEQPLSGARLVLARRAGRGSASVPATPRLAAGTALPSSSTPVHPSELEGRAEVVLKNRVRVFLPRGATQADLSPDDWVAVGAVAEGVAAIRDESLRMLKIVDLSTLGEPPTASTLSEPMLAPPLPQMSHWSAQEPGTPTTAQLQPQFWAQQQAQQVAGPSQGHPPPQPQPALLPGHPYAQAQLQALGHGQPPAQPWQAAPNHHPAAMPFGQVSHPVAGGQTPGLVASPFPSHATTPEIRTEDEVLHHAAVLAPGQPQQLWQLAAAMGTNSAQMPSGSVVPAFADQPGQAVDAADMAMAMGAPVSAERHIPLAGPSQGHGGHPSAQPDPPQDGYGYPQ